jgi:hypothetical protein
VSMAVAVIPLGSPIGEKIAWAQKCLEEQGGLLLQDPVVDGLLSRLEKVSLATREKLAQAGIIQQCRVCEEEEGGSCCGAGIENRYEGIMLLINGLLGVKLPRFRPSPGSCYFLGGNGCLLRARHVLCVNYLCDRVTGRHSPSELAALRNKEGEELDLILLLYDRIGKILAAM